MEPSGSGNEPKTFTQADVDRIVQERLARAKSTPPADYEDLKAKAARLDEIEEANKSDLQKATDAAARAKAAADEWKAKFEALEAEQARMTSVQELATKYKVDAGTLSRMSGDVEDNAKYLADLEAARPKYPGITDNGGNSSSPQTLEEALKGAKTFQEQIWVRAEWNKQHNK
jgi:DNA repair ATPase RecN